MDPNNWKFRGRTGIIEYVGGRTTKNLRRKIWEPAHWWAAERFDLFYSTIWKIDCIGEIPGEEPSNWEIKTCHGDNFLLKRNQHWMLESRGGGYIFIVLLKKGWRWIVTDIVLERAEEIDVDEWKLNREKGYRQAWVSADTLTP